MKRILWIIALALVVGHLLHSCMEKKAKHEAQRVEAERIKQTTKTAVSQMASRTDALTDWEESLSKGEIFRLEPILTIELERLWLQQRPVLFIGAIKDIATHDQSRYMVSVKRTLFSSLDNMFGTELELSLVSDKDRIDSFLKEHPELFNDYGFKNGVAVVALIKSIRTTYVTREDGERDEIKIGDGELMDILYTGDVNF